VSARPRWRLALRKICCANCSKPRSIIGIKAPRRLLREARFADVKTFDQLD